MQDTYDPTEINFPVDIFFCNGDGITTIETTSDYEKPMETGNDLDDGYDDGEKIAIVKPVTIGYE